MGRASSAPTADKANYAIQRNSGDTHWLWSPNGLSTSNVGVRLAQKIGDGWEIVGAVEAGFNPYTLRLVNGPQSQADNNPFSDGLPEDGFRLGARRNMGQRASLHRDSAIPPTGP